MLNPVREGEEDWSDSLPSSLENFWKFLVFFSFCRSVVGTSGLVPSPTSGSLILDFPVFPKSRFSSWILVCWIQWGRERGIEVIRYTSSLEIFWKFLVFFILSVSCWNIRFGAISNFRPTNSASSWKNLRNRVHLFHHLWIFETIFSLFLGWFRLFRIPVISHHRCVQSGS